MHTNLTILDFILSIVASLVASLIFIFLLLFLFRPKIKIAQVICQTLLESIKPECDAFVFKVVNKSWFSAYDILVEVVELNAFPVRFEKGIGKNRRLTPLKLGRERINVMPAYRPNWIRKNYGDYASLFYTYDDVNQILKKGSSSILIRVTLKHGLTGLSKVYESEYINCADIRKGKFAFGKNLNVVS